jgi:ribonuclease P protein component
MAGGPRPKLRFSRGARIKHGRDFLRLKQEGQRLAIGCLVVNWLSLPPGSHSRLGVITSKTIGNAVTRNRARRLMRETFRLHQHDLNQAIDLVIVARQSIAGKAYAQVERDFLTAMRKARLLK